MPPNKGLISINPPWEHTMRQNYTSQLAQITNANKFFTLVTKEVWKIKCPNLDDVLRINYL
jgi:hypothetical protein